MPQGFQRGLVAGKSKRDRAKKLVGCKAALAGTMAIMSCLGPQHWFGCRPALARQRVICVHEFLNWCFPSDRSMPDSGRVYPGPLSIQNCLLGVCESARTYIIFLSHRTPFETRATAAFRILTPAQISLSSQDFSASPKQNGSIPVHRCRRTSA